MSVPKARLFPRIGLVVLLTILVAAFVAGCGGSATTTTSAATTGETQAAGQTATADNPPQVKEWVIPLLGVQTGPVAGWGLDALWAAQLAVKEINEAGGVRGVPIKLQVFDTAMEPDKAITSMNSALAMNPLIIEGPMTQFDGEVAGPLAAEVGIPFFSGFAIKDDGATLKPWGVSLYGNGSRVWQIGVQEWLKLHPDIKSVVLFYVPSDPSHVDEIAQTEKAFKDGGVEILDKVECTLGQLDFGPAATRAFDKKPDGYYSVLNADEQSKLVIELRKLGVNEGWRICTGPGSDGAAYFDAGKGYLEGTYIWDIYFVFNENPRWKALVEAYKAEKNGALPYAPVIAGHYDAIYAIAAAIEATKTTGDPAKVKEEREALRDFLYNAKGLEGVQGAYNYSDAILISPVYMMEVKDNTPTLISTVPAS